MKSTDRQDFPAVVQAHLPETLVIAVTEAIGAVRQWSADLPGESHFYLNEIVTIRRQSDLPHGVNRREVMLADVFFDVHSMLSSLCLQKSWRLEQLAEGLSHAMHSWNLTLGASVARALVETASAWAVESRQLAAVWEDLKGNSVVSEDDAMKIRGVLIRSSKQMCWGTRLTKVVGTDASQKRTNVLTLVAKAERALGRKSLTYEYELLCDAVHPSFGSNECFWVEAGRAPALPQLRVLVSKAAIGWADALDTSPIRPGSPLGGVVLDTSAWAITTMLEHLAMFRKLCGDICLTGCVHLLANLDYWGVVRPTTPDQPCACGSGAQSKACRHSFGGAADA